MPIEPLTKFAPSKRPYAIDLSTFTVETGTLTRADGTTITTHRPRIQAIWVGRKNGDTTISLGELGTGGFGATTLTEFLNDFDRRYGGTCKARWNGHDLWAPGYTPDAIAETAQRLDAILNALPDLPIGYHGWYTLTKKF